MGADDKKMMTDPFVEGFGKVYKGIVAVGVLCVLVVFPLYFRYYYFDILEAKYQFYYMVMIGMFAVCLLTAIAFLAVDFLEYKLAHTRAFGQAFSFKKLRAAMSPADWCLLLFLAVGVISTMQSRYVFEAFWGNEGRFTGLFLHLIYGVGFFLVSRLYRPKDWHMELFLLAAMAAMLFGITDYFQMDLLDFKKDISDYDRDTFMSTFGNINTYVTYVGIIFGCLSTLFVREKKVWKAALYYVSYLVAVTAMIMTNSDNAVLAMGMVFAFLPLAVFWKRQGIERYFLELAGFCACAWAVGQISTAMEGRVIPLYGFFGVVIHLKALLPAATACLCLGAGIHYMGKKEVGCPDGGLGKRYVLAWGIFLILCTAALLFVLYDANWGGNAARYGALSSYLHFSDEWGTYRGMIWRITLEAYGKQPLSHKLWGYGLDTFGLLVYPYQGETGRIMGQVFDSAHNEYLQYLVTIGPIGFLAYLGFLASAIGSLLKNAFDQDWCLAIVFGVGCYLAQAILTINLPIVTPIMWMLLAVGVARAKKGAD